jgi:hypothetical protein
VDQEVAKTLGELELKLQQLEHELTSIGHQAPATAPQSAQSAQSADTPARALSHAPPHPHGRLVDESIEPAAAEQALADGDGFGGPAVFGGEEVPSQAGATTARDWTVDVRETAYGEIPTPPPPGGMPGPPIPPPGPTPQPPPTTPPGPPPPRTPTGPAPPRTPPGAEPQPIDRAELVRFKHKLERTMGDLLDEYSKLLSPKPPA